MSTGRRAGDSKQEAQRLAPAEFTLVFCVTGSEFILNQKSFKRVMPPVGVQQHPGMQKDTFTNYAH